MIFRRFFISTALIFWGWQFEVLWLGAALASGLDSAYWIKSRFKFEASDFNKFVDVSTVLLALVLVLALKDDAAKAIWTLLKWLPAILFPVMAAQNFSGSDRIPLKSFFVTARKAPVKAGEEGRSVDVLWAYALICILPTGTLEKDGMVFGAGIAFFSVWALWGVRSRRTPEWTWAVVIVCILGLGYTGHIAMFKTGKYLRRLVMTHYANRYADNPFKSSMAIGKIGKLKLSNKIILRLKAMDHHPGTTWHLHNGTYTLMMGSTWFSRDTFDTNIPADTKELRSIHSHQSDAGQKVHLYQRPARKRVVLSLPPGTYAIGGMKDVSFEKTICRFCEF